MRFVLAAAVAGLMASACAHTVTNEQRIDGMTDVVVDSNENLSELRCRETAPEVQLARDRSQRKSERLSRYHDAILDAKEAAARFEEAFRKDPDLVYGPNAQEWKRRQLGCTELVATLEREKTRVDLEVEATPVVPEKKAAAAPAPAPAPAAAEPAKSAADEAFEEDADQIRAKYTKKKTKVAKAKKALKKKRRGVSLAAR